MRPGCDVRDGRRRLDGVQDGIEVSTGERQVRNEWWAALLSRVYMLLTGSRATSDTEATKKRIMPTEMRSSDVEEPQPKLRRLQGVMIAGGMVVAVKVERR